MQSMPLSRNLHRNASILKYRTGKVLTMARRGIAESASMWVLLALGMVLTP